MLREQLTGAWLREAEGRYWRLRELRQRMTMARPDVHLMADRQRELGFRFRRAMNARLETLMMSLERQRAHLTHLNPESVLERGYSIAYAADGTVVRDSDQIKVGDTIRVAFAKGWGRANISEKGQ